MVFPRSPALIPSSCMPVLSVVWISGPGRKAADQEDATCDPACMYCCWSARNWAFCYYLAQLTQQKWFLVPEFPAFRIFIWMGWIQDNHSPDIYAVSPGPFCKFMGLGALWVLPVPLLSLADQRLFYYSGNVKITNIRYSNELSRQTSGKFRDLSERVERLVSWDCCAFLLFWTVWW